MIGEIRPYSSATTPQVTINEFGGADYSTVATQIKKNKAEDMLNCMLDKQGMLQQVPGYRKAITGVVSAGATPVRMLTKNPETKKLIKAHAGALYTFLPFQNETLLYSPITDAPMTDFTMGIHQYFINGFEYLRWDGLNAVEMVGANNATVPTTVIGRLPAGGGTTFEATNLLQPKRKNSFRGDGTSTVYYLDSVNLDAMTVTAVVAGTTITEGSGLTVNRTTGAVTFTTAPANNSGVDNVVITFAKTVTGYAERIKNCTFFAIYGVGNNLRVFLSGNSNYRNQDWYSAMQDPTYFPDTNYTKVGSEGVAIKGYALQQGAMQILKEDSSYDPTIWTRTIATNADGTIYFPVRQNNSQIGLIATKSVKAVNDVNYMLSKNGVYEITSTYVADERGLKHISSEIDAKLLAETDLETAVAFDYDGRYGLAINGYVYIIDYNNAVECYRWFGYNAACFIEHDKRLYFGDSKSGNVYIINKFEDMNASVNTFDGQPIEAYWKSKIMSMERSNYYKMVDNIAVTAVPITNRSNLDLYYRTNKKTEKFIKNIPVIVFDIDDINLDYFSVLVSDLPQTINREVNISDIIYFQIILKNSSLGTGFAVSNITIPYSYAGEI